MTRTHKLQIHVSFWTRGPNSTNKGQNAHMTEIHDEILMWWIKNVISFSAMVMVTKVDKVMAYDIGPPSTRLCDSWITCSLMTNKNCYTSNSAIFLPTGFLLAWKSSSVKLFFCYRALIFAQYHNFPDKFVCWSCWFTIWDSQSRIKLMTGTPVKFWRQ